MRSIILQFGFLSILTLHAQRPKFDVFKSEFGHCEPFRMEMFPNLIIRGLSGIWQPRPVVKRTVRFDLYTRLNPYKRQIVPVNDSLALQSSNFNASWPVRIIIHGWVGHTMTCSCAMLKDAYLSRGDFNVLLVDWSDYAMNINYPRVVLELIDVAKQLNEYTAFLHNHTGVAYEEMYLIGHSIAGHISGLAGKQLPPPFKYGVIYGLDIGKAIHERLHHSWRLMPTDAHYVETIHTDAGIFGFGYDVPTASNASFFVNWRLDQRQPHCPDGITIEPEVLCNHFSAVYYFAESIRRPQAFGALQCKDFKSLHMQECRCADKQIKCNATAFMGGEPATPKNGVYYFTTRKRMPFGYGTIVHM